MHLDDGELENREGQARRIVKKEGAYTARIGAVVIMNRSRKLSVFSLNLLLDQLKTVILSLSLVRKLCLTNTQTLSFISGPITGGIFQ